jgi:hypothetical protein
MKNKKESYFVKHPKLISLILLGMLFLVSYGVYFFIISNQEPTATIIEIIENDCHNETHREWDEDNLEILINKKTYTASFSLGGLEETNFENIFSYLNKDKYYANSEICKDTYDYDDYNSCDYNIILNDNLGAYYTSYNPSSNKFYYPYQSPDNFQEWKSYDELFDVNNLMYSRVKLINITGEDIRVEEQSIRNLNGDHNNILVTFEVSNFKIGIKNETTSICEEKTINDTSLLKTIEENNFKDCECLNFECWKEGSALGVEIVNGDITNRTQFCYYWVNDDVKKYEPICLKYSCYENKYLINLNYSSI